MTSADLLLTNSTVVTMDKKLSVFVDGAVAIKGNEIASVGNREELEAAFPSAIRHDCGGKTLMPGLVNVHAHVPMNLLRGLEDDSRLDVWLLGYMMPVEREFVTPEFCRLGTKLACAELIRGGVTTFSDMYYFEDDIAEATAESGLRAICSESIMKYPTPDSATYEDSLDYTREFLKKWEGHPRITAGIAPHAPYTCTEEILLACRDLALEFNAPLHIHIAETRQEAEQFRKDYGMPEVLWLKNLGLFEAKTLAAHCVHIDESEIINLLSVGAGVLHNPSSNLKLASGFAPVYQMRAEGLNVGIGTDGAASNNDLDMFEEMRLASFISKAVTNDPTALPAQEILLMGTRIGAQALHLGDSIGSLETGKRADLILLDLNTFHNWPHYHHSDTTIYARILYATKSSDVTDVMVDGAWLMQDRALLTLDVPPLMEEAARFAKQIDRFLVEREGSVLSKLLAIGGAEREESYEVQLKVKIDDPSMVKAYLDGGNLEIIRTAHYLEYDAYFNFDDPKEGRLRYREDEFVDDQGEVYNVRYRLTLTGPAAEHEYPNSVLLSRSRFIAPANHSHRFYLEYFKPRDEIEVNKDRLRWLVRYQGLEFFINIDRVLKPAIEGCFLEIKSRTWSLKDAENKARLISSLMETLGVKAAEPISADYPTLATP
ncbi:MAG: amidohydrolase [Anaerolineales bacterium]|nr:amidohydrolase [Anaerolineales bacterium]